MELLKSELLRISKKLPHILLSPWENKRLGELFGISGQFTDKNTVLSV